MIPGRTDSRALRHGTQIWFSRNGDGREDSPTYKEINEFFAGKHNRMLLRIPPYVYHGFKAVGTEECMILNIPTEPYNRSKPDELRLDPHNGPIPYDWSRKDG